MRKWSEGQIVALECVGGVICNAAAEHIRELQNAVDSLRHYARDCGIEFVEDTFSRWFWPVGDNRQDYDSVIGHEW